MTLIQPWPAQYSINEGRGFGLCWHPIYKAMRWHHGVDVAGTFPVTAPADGVIKHIGWDPDGGGHVVLITHKALGIVTAYYHGKDRTTFSKGDSISTGEVIYTSGTTGASTGNHLHWEVRGINGVWGNTKNPVDFISGTMKDKIFEINGKLDIFTWKALQTALKSFGLYAGRIDGDPGPLTITALQIWADAPETDELDDETKRAVQRRLGVTPDAIWGSVTITELQKELTNGLAGPRIKEPELEVNGDLDVATWKALQTALKSHGLYTGPLDGLPSAPTYTALQLWSGAPETGKLDVATRKAVQVRLGVTPDAVWGSITISEMQRELLAGLAGPSIPKKEPKPAPEPVPVVVVPEPVIEPEPVVVVPEPTPAPVVVVPEPVPAPAPKPKPKPKPVPIPEPEPLEVVNTSSTTLWDLLRDLFRWLTGKK